MPILILRDGNDKRVSVTQALHTAMKLHELHRQYKLIVYDEGSHSLRRFDQEISRQLIAWFRHKLHIDDDSH